MTPNEVVCSLSDADLRQSVTEALDWRRKGVLSGDCLRQIACRLTAGSGVEDSDAIRMADGLVIQEAASRFARQV